MSAGKVGAPVEYYDRYSGSVREEAIYGEPFLRWAYENRLGGVAVELLAKRAFFSRWYGLRMSRRASRARIEPFLEEYGIDPEEFVDPVDAFDSFNDFFSRRLKPAARPIDPSANAAVFPADGRHLAVPDLSRVDGLWAKGQLLDLEQLIGDPSLAERFQNGSALISRLCPVDYHRFHFPLAGEPDAPRLIDGSLYSVSPLALRRRLEILIRNKRCLTRLHGLDQAVVLLLEVGATNVGSIVQTYRAGEPVEKGEEKGYFQFGGSMTLTFFEPGYLRFDDDLLEQSALGRELYARMGDRCATVAG